MKNLLIFMTLTLVPITILSQQKNKELDKKIANAILELFRKRENLDIFNKKAFYIFIKEQVDADTPAITKIIKRMKDIYKELYNQYSKNGFIEKL